jgi:hypothetical protein
MALETKIISVDGYKDKDGTRAFDYTVTKLPAKKGLDVQLRLMDETISADFVQDVICSSVALGSVKMSPAKFDDHFSGKYSHLMDVYNSVLEFNFDENFTESGSVED